MLEPINNNEPQVSVILITRNRYDSLKEAVNAILNQTFSDFELIIIDDASEDQTKNIIEDFKDKRIRYLRNIKNLGIAQARNIGINMARAKFIFFTDDDCSPYRDWLREGVKILQKEPDILAIQGFVVMERFDPSRVFRRVRSVNWSNNFGNFMCANMAFPKETLIKLGGFNVKFNQAYEDVDIGLRAREMGKVIFSREMIVNHRQLPYTHKEIIAEARRAREQVRIIKYHPDDWDYHRQYSAVIKLGPLKIMHPQQFFFCMVFPVYVIAKFIWGRYYRSLKAFKMFPMLCLYILIQRLYVWRTGFEERVLVI